MAKATPSYAKNIIRRAFLAIIDAPPTPAQVERAWAYFNSSCAYCGQSLDRKKRDGQLDHLVSATAGGPNHISNRVLACGPCNGDEKREKEWSAFLTDKITDKTLCHTRKMKIEEWVRSMSTDNSAIPKELSLLVETEIDNVIKAFDAALLKVREARNKSRRF